MAIKTRKKNCKTASSNNDQTSKMLSKVNESSVKGEARGSKRRFSEEYENDQLELNESQANNPASVVRNLVINNIDNALGLSNASIASKFHKEVIINQIKRFELSKVLSPFDRRVTAISWHPKYPQIFVAGSKGGDLLLHNFNGTDDYFSPGVGAGGSVLGLKCNLEDPHVVYTASLTGKISCDNFEKRKSSVLFYLPTSYDNWLTSLDVCQNRILTGDCKGNIYLLSSSGKLIWQQKKVHSSKVTHCEFNVHDPDIIVTSSNDHSVKLWDLRTFSSSEKAKPVPLAAFPHIKAVNAAYFSPSNGKNILTTDQYSELRVYSGHLWEKVVKITHPHRQFQHMTQMKAVWHPLEDIVIVGRYPDDNIQTDDTRTIDFYNGSNGKLLHQIVSPTNLIVSLNAVNSTGETLAAAAGFDIVFLKDDLVIKGDKPEVDLVIKGDKPENTNLKLNKKKKGVAKVSKKIYSKKTIASKKIS